MCAFEAITARRHGLLAAAALTLLVFAAFTLGLPSLAPRALVLFLVAAPSGVYLNPGYQEKRA